MDVFHAHSIDPLMEAVPSGSTRFQFELNSEPLFLGGGLLDQLRSIPENSISEYNESMEHFILPIGIESVPKTGTLQN